VKFRPAHANALNLFNTGTPSAGTDLCHIYSADQTAGNACPHVRTENGDTVKLYKLGTVTQSYATADATLSAYTPDDESAAYTGINNLEAVGTPYAQVADLNALRTAYENLRAFSEDQAKLINYLVDSLQAAGWLG
jgi:hypothetical protein